MLPVDLLFEPVSPLLTARREKWRFLFKIFRRIQKWRNADTELHSCSAALLLLLLLLFCRDESPSWRWPGRYKGVVVILHRRCCCRTLGELVCAIAASGALWRRPCDVDGVEMFNYYFLLHNLFELGRLTSGPDAKYNSSLFSSWLCVCSGRRCTAPPGGIVWVREGGGAMLLHLETDPLDSSRLVDIVEQGPTMVICPCLSVFGVTVLSKIYGTARADLMLLLFMRSNQSVIYIIIIGVKIIIFCFCFVLLHCMWCLVMCYTCENIFGVTRLLHWQCRHICNRPTSRPLIHTKVRSVLRRQLYCDIMKLV